jgi:uncharacterized protein YceH (UPF0502 family)
MKKYMVSDKSAGYGGRVTKYRQRFCNTEFGPLKFSPQELGILCVLLLRGPQTPGELRSRTNRLVDFTDAQQVESTLQALMEREDGPFVARLARAAGEREARYGHLFSGVPEWTASAESERETAGAVPGAAPSSSGATLAERLTQLEAVVETLRREVEALKSAPR